MKKARTLKEAEALCKEIGIKLPPATTKAPGKISRSQFAKPPARLKRAQTIKLLRFAIAHNFYITPTGAGYYIESFTMFNACPCDQKRKACPCPEAVREVQEEGKCLCHLFWRDYETYLEEKLNVKKDN